MALDNIMAKLQDIIGYTGELLQIGSFKDYGPNGLQVQGKDDVKHLISGVTASQALIDAAIAEGADALLVHHGYFWRNEDPAITGIKKKRIQALLSGNVSLLAYHLPLDAHAELGNNAQLAKRLSFEVEGVLSSAELVMHGQLNAPLKGNELAERIASVLGRQPLYIKGHEREVRRVAWCSGGAQGYFENAIAAGVDAYITGEASEQNYHLAREYGVDFIAAGHHATERFGAMALGEHLAEHFSLSHKFIDIENPI